MRLSKLQIKLKSNEYPPSEDTFFLEDQILNEKGKLALDIGSGSGYLTRSLEKSFKMVVGTDINFKVLTNQTYKTKNLVCCNGADPLYAKFDLVICNLPYLATDTIDDPTTDGGPEGLELPLKIISSAQHCLKKNAKMIFITTSLSNYNEMMRQTANMGFKVRIMAKKKLFFEELLAIEAVKI